MSWVVVSASAQPKQTRVTASIVMVSYNSRRYLEAALGSVLTSVDDWTDYEIIVVDNASTDGSADFVAQKFPQVQLIRNQHNEGFAAANNRAVVQSSGRYIVALNPDTVVTKGWLEALLAPLQCDPTTGLTTARLMMTSAPDRINTCGNAMHYTGLTFCRGLGQTAEGETWQTAHEVAAISGACFAMPRDLWERLGGLDPIFFTYLEDTDLSVRVRLAGYSCQYVPGAVVYHDYGLRLTARKLYYLERNRLLMLFKNYQTSSLKTLLPALLLTEGVVWGYALKSGPSHVWAKLRSYGWLIQNRVDIKAWREDVQSHRRVSDWSLATGLENNLDIGQLAGGKVAKIADRWLNPLYARLYRRWKKGGVC